MNRSEALDLLIQIRDGAVSPEEALLRMRAAPFEDLGFAKVDHHRGLRQGVAEVIYGAGKTPEQIVGIASAMRDGGGGHKSGAKSKNASTEEAISETVPKDINPVIITRILPDAAETIQKSLPLQYFDTARIGIVGEMPKPDGIGRVVVATGGTSDIPVAEEAAVTAEALGNEVVRLYDVGVAGLHRMLSRLDDIMDAQAIVAIAGMEGALASVIGGLAGCPVIGVPTSVGYGASFGGVSALLSMLNSCACGVSVVNIDNGFGAGYLASMINHRRTQ